MNGHQRSTTSLFENVSIGRRQEERSSSCCEDGCSTFKKWLACIVFILIVIVGGFAAYFYFDPFQDDDKIGAVIVITRTVSIRIKFYNIRNIINCEILNIPMVNIHYQG
jgi:hypothetical protein